jgi:spore coat polysaccharide biosynthesis protein SpsF
MKAVVIIQARMGSSRLPSKALAPLAGRPMLYHVVERARPLGLPVIVATSRLPADDPIALYAGDIGASVVRGSEANVLERFLTALSCYPSATHAVRVCGDAPLWSPDWVARCLGHMSHEPVDLVTPTADTLTVYQGAEVVSVRALRATVELAGADPLATEHVTAWACRHAEEAGLRVGRLDLEPWELDDVRLSVDTLEDLRRVAKVYDALYRRVGDMVPLRLAVEFMRNAGRSASALAMEA